MTGIREYLGVGLLCLLCWGVSNGADDGLPRARPEELGFSSERLDYIDNFYSEEVKHGELAGIVTLIARRGKVVHFSAVGFADVEKRTKLETDALFRVYSMTKPIASVALMMLYEEGRFELTDPVSKYLPEFSHLAVLRDPDGSIEDTVAPERAPTIQDVMRHTAGFTHGLLTDTFDSLYSKANVFGLDVSLADMMSRLAKLPLRYQPGTQFAYSVGPDIEARLVEVLSGMPFREFLEKRLFAPLGMMDTDFWVTPEKAGRLATVHWKEGGKLVPLDDAHGHPPGGVLVQPWSVNSYTAKHPHTGGSFGLVSTAADYWRFAQMLSNGGELNGRRILSPQIVRYMTRDHLGSIPIRGPGDLSPGVGFGLGFGVMKDSAAAAYPTSEGSYFWGGAANTLFWVDPKKDIVVVAMTQHLNVPAAEAIWTQMSTLVYSALME
jgi:CubicO group peptidase (beta-lactamase class C family)